MKSHCSTVSLQRSLKLTGTLALACLGALTAQALHFEKGELKLNFDTTLSLGAMARLQNPSPELYGTSNIFQNTPGLQNSVNADDGNLNFEKGFISQMAKASHDLEIRYRNFGGLLRGYYFYDTKIMDHWDGRTALSHDAISRVGRGAEWLDMYAFAKLEVLGRPLDLRLGRQVLSLGESTFLPNGLNAVNAVDLSKLRAPGAELKEALLPVNMLKASLGLSNSLSIEPFWLLEFRRNEIEPAGTYFSSNDFASRGGKKVMLGFGSLPDSGFLGAISREDNREGGRYNQGGLAMHWHSAQLNDTDFGFYYLRYHSRSPLISSRTPTQPQIAPDLSSQLTALLLRSAGPNPSSTTIEAAKAQASGIAQAYILSKTNPAALTAGQLGLLQSPSVQSALSSAAFLNAAASGRYFIEYPEGIDMLGLSFNTNLARTGIAVQGEIAYKNGVPLQVDDVELLFATVSALTPAYGNNNQLGNYYGQFNKEISGFRRHDVWTGQTTFTKIFGPALGASQFTCLAEVGGLWADLPSKEQLRYDAPGTFTGGNAEYMLKTGNGAYPATDRKAFATPFSWGYQLLARAEYSNLFSGVNLSPSLAFSHDVQGNSPLPLGNYVTGRKSITLGAEFTYLNRWTLDLRYINFFDAGRYNLLGDRDYVSATIKYSF